MIIDRDWADDWISDPCIVVRGQAAIAVFPNAREGITIKQQGGDDEAGDTIVLVAPEYARAVAEAILRVLAEGWPEQVGHPPHRAPPSEPRDTTGAERQRRYRDRHRNGLTVTGDGVTRDGGLLSGAVNGDG
jgi:hypothetical protein